MSAAPIFSRATTSGSLSKAEFKGGIANEATARQFAGRPSFLRATARMPSTNIPSARRAVGSREISGLEMLSERLKIEVERLKRTNSCLDPNAL